MEVLDFSNTGRIGLLLQITANRSNDLNVFRLCIFAVNASLKSHPCIGVTRGLTARTALVYTLGLTELAKAVAKLGGLPCKNE